MSPPGRGWDEEHLSEEPAVVLLQKLGYTYLPPEQLEEERETYRETVLVGRLGQAIKKLNPWLNEENLHKAVRAVTGVQGASLLEINEKLHTTLTYGIALEQDRGDGRRSHTVRFIDFENPSRNELLVTRQFKVRGTRQAVVADVVVFVNGLPLVIIECKSPALGEGWAKDGVEQLLRYQELGEEYRELGAPRLFETAQLLVITCGQGARYGTVGTPQRFFAEWKNPFPCTVAELSQTLGRAPNPQDVLLAGMLDSKNLLDIIRNFVVFERDLSSGRTVRKICRYQQFVTVNKAIERAKGTTSRGSRPADRGGVVWHTQGSGKSLTMLWLALKLRRDPAFKNPTLVVVTDRTDLDQQITKTFHNCGFPNPETATSVRHLRELLTGPIGKTVLTTIHKFQEIADSPEGNGVFTPAGNVFVLVDEAHRTQYKSLAARMRRALPYAAFFGFTGTPIDKHDRSTVETFGPYIDTYTIDQAVKDGATVPIFYEARMPELRVVGAQLDVLFERVFADRTEEERQAIKARYATPEAVAAAPKRIEAIVLDLIDHFIRYIQPNGFKAQVVACTREAAVAFKETLDRLHAPPSAILISGTNDDPERLVRYHTTDQQRQEAIASFLNREHPLAILVVCDMLLTGFDAPVEQVMYLDSPLREHTLLQAIARVNRTADGKTYGLIVDYWGVSDALEEALAIFAPEDVRGAMVPKVDELPRLQARHAAVLKYFAKVRNQDDLEEMVKVLEPEDVRSEFNQAFRRFSQSLDMLLPDPRALPYVSDARWLGKVRQAAAARYRDPRLDVSDCGAKVRKLIDDAIVADGMTILVQKVELFTKEFDQKLGALKTDEARASEMEHAIRDEIHVHLDEDPVFYKSLKERLEEIVAETKARRMDAARQLELFKGLVKDMAGHAREAERLGLTPAGLAIYNLLHQAEGFGVAATTEPRQELVRRIEGELNPLTGIVEWTRKEDIQRQMRRVIKRRLREGKFPEGALDSLANGIVELLKARYGR